MKAAPTPASGHSHDKKSHWNAMTIGAMAILIVVVVTFIGAPVISNSMGTPSVTFGTYDGVPIEFKDGNAFSDMVRTQSQRIGEVDVETAKRYIWRPAFERAVMNIGLEREARLGGLQVSSDRLKSMLRYNPAFLDKNGKFDYEKDANMSPSEKFRLRNTTESETLAMTYASYSTLGIRIVNTQNTDFVKKTIYPQRQFSFVVFNETDYPDEEVIQFATKNASLFNTLTLKKITLATEAEGKLKRDEVLKKEKTFEELAKLYSKDELAASGGVMGSKFYYELKNEITKVEDLDALFKLKKDEISFLTKTAAGWTFYQVTEESKPSDPKNLATITTARNYIIGSEPALIQNYLEAKAKALKAASVGKTFADEAKKIGKTVEIAGPIALNFGNMAFAPLVSKASTNPVFASGTLGINPEFFQKAFSVKIDEVTDPILDFSNDSELRKPRVLVMKLDSLIEAPADIADASTPIREAADQDMEAFLTDSIMKSPKFKDHFEEGFKARLTPGAY